MAKPARRRLEETMFYEPHKNNHGLRHNPFKAICVPRPIGWVSSMDVKGTVNLAPFSQYNNLGFDPPYIMISAGRSPRGGRKDTTKNIVKTGEFVVNTATYDLRDAVRITSQAVDHGVDEAALAGLDLQPSTIVKPPRVAASPIHLECVLHSILMLPGRTPRGTHDVIIGRVVGIHIRDDLITADGKVDVLKLRPLARLGYYDYTSVESCFTMKPEGPHVESLLRGMEGRPQMPEPENAPPTRAERIDAKAGR
jgi:flavin reductase (DIM6/NTAB) family NADH-FMN oxidoreductase RutF